MHVAFRVEQPRTFLTVPPTRGRQQNRKPDIRTRRENERERKREREGGGSSNGFPGNLMSKEEKGKNRDS